MQKIALGIFVCVIFIIRIISYERVHVSQISEDLFNKKTTITSVITEDPNRGLSNTKIVLGELGIMATIQNSVDVAYGDRVSVSGTIKYPENFMTDTGREFDYVNYLAMKDIYGVMNAATIQVLEHHQKNIFVEKLFTAKQSLVKTIKKLFPKSEAGLLAGIVIGEKSLLPKSALEDFQIAGLTHMIVLSGYNITIIATVTITALAYLGFGYRGRRVGTLLIIPIFLIMTGLGASSVRAGIMSMIVFLLQITTRPQYSLRIIFYSAGVMIFMNPRIFLHDPGFHMSFLAFIGLVYVTPVMNFYFNKNESEFFLKKLIIETLSVQIFVMPYILWMSGRVSLLLLFSNILTVPFVPFIMGAGFLVTSTGMLFYPLGALLVWPVKLGLSYIIWIAHGVASVKVATFVIPPFGIWIMLVVYGVLVGYLIWFHRRGSVFKK